MSPCKLLSLSCRISLVERIDKGFSSLVSCYALLATLAFSFLIYAHWAFTAHPPQWADQVGSFVTRPSSGNALHLAKALSAVRIAALYFHERAHTTRLYFGVFAAVWLACLLWTLIRRRRRVAIYGRGLVWIGAMSLVVLAGAALYGLGTRGVFPQRIPVLSRVSDAVAAGFLLALPLITWSRARRRADDEDLDGESGSPSEVSAHRLARLGLGNEMSSELSVVPPREGSAPLEISSKGRSADSSGPSQNSQTEDHATFAANRLIARAAAPVVEMPRELVAVADPEPVAVALPEPAVVPSAALALVQAEPFSALVPEPIASQVAEPIPAIPAEHIAAVVPERVEAEPVAVQMSEPVVEAPEAVHEVLPEPVAEISAEHSFVEAIAFRISDLIDDEAVGGSAVPEAEGPLAVLPGEHSAVAFQIYEAIAGVASEPVAVLAEEPIAMVAEEPVTIVAEEAVTPRAADTAITAEHTLAEPVEFQTVEAIALVGEEPAAAVDSAPVAIVAEETVSIALTEPVAEVSVEHFAAEHFALETPEPTVMVLEEPHTVVPEPVAVVAEDPVALPPAATAIPSKPVTVAQLEPLRVSFATLEPIAMSAEPIAVFPPASVAAVIPAESVTVAQPEPICVAPVEPIAAVAADPVAVLPPAQVAAVLPAEPVTVGQPEPLLVSAKPAEPITVVPRESIAALPPAPVAVMPPKPKSVPQPEQTPLSPPTPTREPSNHSSLETGDEFLHGLSTLNRSWRRIETMQEEMDEWFKLRRRQALAQAATPPAMRNSSLGTNLVQDLSEKMAAIDAQWVEIRNAALGISRAVGDAPDDQNK